MRERIEGLEERRIEDRRIGGVGVGGGGGVVTAAWGFFSLYFRVV